MTTLERILLTRPFAMLTFDPVALFAPATYGAWRASMASRKACHRALGSAGTLRASHVRFDPDEPLLVDVEIDCIGRTVIMLNSAALARMVVGSGQMPLWSYSLDLQDRYGWKPARLRRWLRSFLRSDDAAAAERMLTKAHHRARCDLPSMQSVAH